MKKPLSYWAKQYQQKKYESRCIDLEFHKGKITVVGIYQPHEGLMDHIALIKDDNLNEENLKGAFFGCKMLIAYNGFSMDIPMMKKEFPGILPSVPVFDVYFVAKELGLDTNLKVLERTLGIERMDDYSSRRGIASDLWRRWKQYHDEQARATLIEYNRQDTINLFPIAEKLVDMIEKNKNDA